MDDVTDNTVNGELNDSNSSHFNELKRKFALKNANIGIWEFDANLNRVFFSEESKNIIGFTSEAFGSNPQDWNDRVHPDDKSQYFKDFQDHLKGLNPIYTNVHRIRCKDETYKWISDKGKIIERDQEGNPLRIIGTHLDITKLKEKELANAKLLKLLTLQNERLTSFAHIVTHNLKSHSGNFENLLEFYDEAETATEKEILISHIKTVTQSLSKTISNLHEIVSIQTNKNEQIQALNIHTYINNAIKLLEVEIEQSKAMVINDVNSLINIDFNPAYLESVFQNLLSNSIKYKHPERNPLIKFNSSETKSSYIITVLDNGIGIDMEKYGNEVFNLYRTFHKNENSEGVGLYLTKNHIESYGGTIELDSATNKGSIFTIKFPKKKLVN